MAAKKPAKGNAPAVEFSNAPAEKKTRGPRTGTKNQPMAVPIMDSSDENASKLMQSKREAEEKARLENIDYSNWEPVNSSQSDIAPTAAADPSSRFNPTDLARRLGVLNKNLLTNKKAVITPEQQVKVAAKRAEKEKYGPAGVVTSQEVSFVPRQIASRINVVPEQKDVKTGEVIPPFVTRGEPVMGGVSSVPGQIKTQPYFTPEQINNRSQLLKQQQQALAATSSETTATSDEYLESRMRKPTPAELLPPPKSAPELPKQVSPNKPVTKPVFTQNPQGDSAANALPHMHGVEHNEITGEVRLTPIHKSYDGSNFPMSLGAKTFGPNEEISASNFRAVPGKYHYIAGESVQAHTKSIDTWKRTNNNGKFGVVKGSSVAAVGTFYKHPETGRVVQTFDNPTDWRPSVDQVEQAKKYYATHNDIYDGSIETPVLPRSILEAHTRAENQTGYNTAIEKHHVELYKNYNFKRFVDGADKSEKQLSASNYATNNPEESKKWVADNLHKAISDSGEDHLTTMASLEKNPDQIHDIFNNHFVVKPQREKDYKNAIKRGLVPKRVVPSTIRPNSIGIVVPPASSSERITRAAAQGISISRSDALGLGASEGR